MSRAVFLNMGESAAIAHCEAKNIGISSIGRVATGGIRLVCMSVAGAGRIRSQLKGKLTKGAAILEQRGPGADFVARA